MMQIKEKSKNQFIVHLDKEEITVLAHALDGYAQNQFEPAYQELKEKKNAKGYWWDIEDLEKEKNILINLYGIFWSVVGHDSKKKKLSFIDSLETNEQTK